MLAQIRAHQKLGTAAMFADVDTELKQRFDSLIKELGDRITLAIASDDRLSDMAIDTIAIALCRTRRKWAAPTT